MDVIPKIALDEEVIVRIYKQLEAFGRTKYGDKIYATENYQDCLQKVLFRGWRRSVAAKPCDEDLKRYFQRAIDYCFRDAFRRAKRTDLLMVEDVQLVSDADSLATPPGNPHAKLEPVVEVSLMKSWFPGDDYMHKYIDLLTLYKKRSEIANEMDLDARAVTDLHRRLKRRLKRYFAERGIHIRGS